MTPYEEIATPAELRADCEATQRRIDENRVSRALAEAAERAVAPAPSILFDDFPREVRKRDIEVSAAAQRLANALHLHLD